MGSDDPHSKERGVRVAHETVFYGSVRSLKSEATVEEGIFSKV